jgi:hypothetical protein
MAEPIVSQRLTPRSDEDFAAPVLSRLGAYVDVPFKLQLALAGYCFVTTNSLAMTDTVIAEVAAASWAIDPVEPSFMFDIPDGTAVLPLEVSIGLVSSGANLMVAVMSDNVKRYTSGGTAAVAARNLKTDSSYGSVVESLYDGGTSAGDLTTISAKNERIHYQWTSPDDLNAGEGLDYPNILWQPAVPPVLVGPASFMIYVHNDGTAAEFRYSVTWAELPSTMVE